MILGVQVQEDPFEKMKCILSIAVGSMTVAYILGIIIHEPSKKELLKRIDTLESEIISKYLAINDQVIIP